MILTFKKPNGTLFIIDVPELGIAAAIANYTAKGFVVISDEVKEEPVKRVKRGKAK